MGYHPEVAEIRRLRLKFICVNMLIVTVMMGVIFGLVYHFTQTGLETQSVSMLQSIAAEPFRPNRPGKPPEGVQLPFFSWSWTRMAASPPRAAAIVT